MLPFVAIFIAGCQPFYDVTAGITGASFHFVAAPSRPRNLAASDATVFVAGAKLLIAADGPVSLVFADGRKDAFITPRGSAPYPRLLVEAPSDDNAMIQVMTCELYLSQLLQSLPANLQRWMHDPEADVRVRATTLARQIVQQHNVAVSGMLGRWWYFSGSYALMPADRERLAAAIGEDVSDAAPAPDMPANVSAAGRSATSTAATHADPRQ